MSVHLIACPHYLSLPLPYATTLSSTKDARNETVLSLCAEYGYDWVVPAFEASGAEAKLFASGNTAKVREGCGGLIGWLVGWVGWLIRNSMAVIMPVVYPNYLISSLSHLIVISSHRYDTSLLCSLSSTI